jgi:general secretion pathway protein A
MREQTVFPLDVLSEIHRRTQGIPRLINGVCDNLLLTAFAMEKRQTTLSMLDEVARDMHLEWPEPLPLSQSSSGRPATL